MRIANRPLRFAVRSLVLGLFCSGMVVAVAGTASATPVEAGYDYRCALPNGHSLPVRAEITAGLPDDLPGRLNSMAYLDEYFIDVDVTLSLDHSVLGGGGGGGLRIDGDSTATLAMTFEGPSGTTTTEAGLTFAPTRVGRGPLSLKAAGGSPALSLRRGGDHTLHPGDLTLTLRPELANGRPLGTITTTCTRAPGQTHVLGSVFVQTIIMERPNHPTDLSVTALTPTSVAMAWKTQPWWYPDLGYEVYLDGTKVAFVQDHHATLTGLIPDTQHRLKIVTRGWFNLLSSPGEGMVFATPPVR
ncbi:fibronectin type III domain-containing protein [Actinosynnema sp. NPDC023587]|uniref:fibronectin type III domain-containing protein n=1 Tax=Actinosynnema sp. NPDC023587 TaxID=3154695 RepID=UPI003404494F